MTKRKIIGDINHLFNYHDTEAQEELQYIVSVENSLKMKGEY